MAQESPSRFTESDLAALTDLHKFYFDLLVKGATFAATAQAATVAIGGQNLTDPGHIQMVGFGVGIVALLACVFFFASLTKLIEIDRWINEAHDQHRKAWRPHSDMLWKISLAAGSLNFIALSAAILAIIDPATFARP